MEDWKVRLLEEQKDLKGRIVKLVCFMNSLDFYEISEDERVLLHKQLECMEQYNYVLIKRIVLLGLNGKTKVSE